MLSSKLFSLLIHELMIDSSVSSVTHSQELYLQKTTKIKVFVHSTFTSLLLNTLNQVVTVFTEETT